MSKLKYKLWCRVEVYDPATDEHEDLVPEICEYKIFESDDLAQVAEFIMYRQAITGDHESGVLLELEDALQRQGLNLNE